MNHTLFCPNTMTIHPPPVCMCPSASVILAGGFPEVSALVSAPGGNVLTGGIGAVLLWQCRLTGSALTRVKSCTLASSGTEI